MKKLIAMLSGAVAWLGFMASLAVAAPAFVMNMGPICTSPWASTDPAHPFVLLEGVGTSVETNNGMGTKMFSCQLYRHTSEPVWVTDLFTGELVLVTLASIEETCAIFGLDVCQKGKYGAIIASSENGLCSFGAETTTDWQRQVTPSGLDHIVCRFPARNRNR